MGCVVVNKTDTWILNPAHALTRFHRLFGRGLATRYTEMEENLVAHKWSTMR